MKRRPLLAFFALTFALTWDAWFTSAKLVACAGCDSGLMFILSRVAFYIGVFSPGIVAVFMTWRLEGQVAVSAMVGRMFSWSVAGRWYAFALFFIIAIKIVAAAAHRAIIGEWPQFVDPPVVLAVLLMFAATFFSTLVGGQAGEEVGWRGFALPRMAEQMGLGWASILLGVIWAAWHLPIFYLFPDADTFHQSFPLYAMQVTATSVAVAWLYAKTGGSLFLTMLFHAAHNNTKDIVRSAPAEAGGVWSLHGSPMWWLSIGLLWVCATWFLIRMPRTISAHPQPAR